MSHTAKVIAVLGRTLRAGRWKLADDTLVIAVFGRCVMDLSRAYVDEEDDELSMTVFALFGSVSIVLPPGCDVEPSGIALLASSEVAIPSDKPLDITKGVLAPLDISWIAMFGRVRINELAGQPKAQFAIVEEVLSPPAVEVFDGDAAVPEAAPETREPEPAPESAPDETAVAEQQATAAAEVEAEQAALQDEIAQWRSETGRQEPDNRPPAEPDTEIEPDADDDGAATGVDPSDAETADAS